MVSYLALTSLVATGILLISVQGVVIEPVAREGPFDGSDNYKIQLLSARCSNGKEYLSIADTQCSNAGPRLRKSNNTLTVWRVKYKDYFRDLDEGKYFSKASAKLANKSLKCKGYLAAPNDCGSATVNMNLNEKNWLFEQVPGSTKNLFYILQANKAPGCKRYLTASSDCGNNNLKLVENPTKFSNWTLKPQFAADQKQYWVPNVTRSTGTPATTVKFSILPPSLPEWPIGYRIVTQCVNASQCPVPFLPGYYNRASSSPNETTCYEDSSTCTPTIGQVFGHTCGVKYRWSISAVRPLRTEGPATVIEGYACLQLNPAPIPVPIGRKLE